MIQNRFHVNCNVVFFNILDQPVGYIMNTTDWFVFIQQEHYFAPKCSAGLLWLLRP